jgi:hypothetical protein
VIASPLRPRHRQEPGIAAAGRLAHRGTPYGTSLSFATTTHLWPLPDPPSQPLRAVGNPEQKSGEARPGPARWLSFRGSGSERSRGPRVPLAALGSGRRQKFGGRGVDASFEVGRSARFAAPRTAQPGSCWTVAVAAEDRADPARLPGLFSVRPGASYRAAVASQTAVSSAPDAVTGDATSPPALGRGLAGRRIAIPSPARATTARTIIAAT